MFWMDVLVQNYITMFKTRTTYVFFAQLSTVDKVFQEILESVYFLVNLQGQLNFVRVGNMA